MKYTTRRPIAQLLQTRVHLLVLFSLLGLALLGQRPEGQAGWITCPPAVVVAPQKRGLSGAGVWQAAVAPARLSGGGMSSTPGAFPCCAVGYCGGCGISVGR